MGQGSHSIYLYLHGVPLATSSSFEMVMPNTGYGSGTYVSDSIYLYTTGEGLIRDASIYNKYINLFLQGGTEASGQFDLFALGHSVGTESVYLYTAGVLGVATSGVDMVIPVVHDTDSDSIRLFARGYNA